MKKIMLAIPEEMIKSPREGTQGAIFANDTRDHQGNFGEMFTKFCHNSADSKTLFNLINYIPNKESIPTPNTLPLNSSQGANSYLADCLYAFASYIMSKTHIIKSRKRDRESLDLNKGVLTET